MDCTACNAGVHPLGQAAALQDMADMTGALPWLGRRLPTLEEKQHLEVVLSQLSRGNPEGPGLCQMGSSSSSMTNGQLPGAPTGPPRVAGMS